MAGLLSTRIVRNLSIENIRPSRPTRCCLKSTGPRDEHRTAIATRTSRGMREISRSEDDRTSSVRLRTCWRAWMRSAVTGGPAVSHRVASGSNVVCMYAALMVVLPLFWFPARLPLLTLVALPVLPLVVVAALRSATPGVVRSGLERPLVVVLLATCLAAAPVADWQLGLPKLLGVAFG